MLAIIAVLSGVAAALPPALLGPDGPLWVGTVVPGEAVASAVALGRPVAVVIDPATGALHLEERDGDRVRRAWDGARWTVEGGGIDEAWPPREGFRYDLDDEGVLVSAHGSDGSRRRYLYEEGRLVGILWQDGGRMVVAYDAQGRVARIDGPGTARVAVDWSASGGLSIRDALGRVSRVRPVSPGDLGAEAWEVDDGAGRVVRTWFAGEGASRTVSAWQDPRGRTTRVRREGGALTVTVGGGAVWRIEADADRQPLAVVDPLGARWTWERDDYGRVARVVDPTGRITVWRRDGAGRVVAVERAGQVTRIGRDGAGRVVSVLDAAGGETRIERSPAGHVIGVTDAAGNTLHLQRGAGGRLDAIVSRSGGRWAFAHDLLGRPDRVVDPTDRVVELERDGAGRVSRVVDRRFGTLGVRRAADGDITAIDAPDGRRLGLVRDPLGRVTQVRFPSGLTMGVERDPAGDVAAVTGPWGVVDVRRDAAGRPLSVGPVSWRWDGSGRLVGLRWPGVTLEARRDEAGRLEAARAGLWEVAVGRDVAGRPVRWSGTDPAVELTRDPAGRVIGERTPWSDARVVRDPRGRIDRAASALGEWRWARDAAGRSLRVSGPGGLSVGTDWDAAGRPTLVRLPGGGLVTWHYEGDLVQTEVTDGGGLPALVRAEARDAAGRVRWRQEGDAPQVAWSRGEDGRLLGMAAEGTSGWTFTGDAVLGPGGAGARFDARGQLRVGRPPVGPSAWGVASAELRATADPDIGRLVAVSGDGGAAALGWDDVGRLARVALPTGDVTILRDGRGRVAGWRDPAVGAAQVVRLPTDDPAEAAVLGLTGDRPRPWVPGPHGPAGWSADETSTGVALDQDGVPLAVQVGHQPAVRVQVSPLGFPDSGAAGAIGQGDWLVPRAGLPLLRGARAVDPVGGRDPDGLGTWPWAPLPVPTLGAGAALRDPRPWAPESPWADPLRLLVALGALAPVDRADWWTPAPEASALPWLPDDLDGVRPPLGPAPGALPISLDPVTRCVVAAALPGGSPLAADTPLLQILSDEIDLNGLPPGVVVPGLEALSGGGDRCGTMWLAPRGTTP